MKTIKGRIQAVNQALSWCQVVQHAGRLYIRSSRFPPKPGSNNPRPEFATGLRATVAELHDAAAIASEIDGQLRRGTFAWADWLKPKAAKPRTVADWVEVCEQEFWLQRERTPTGQILWWDNYGAYYKHLPQEAPLTEEILVKGLERYKPASRQRQMGAIAFGKLAGLAGLPTARITRMGRGYKPKPKSTRDLLSDAEIAEMIDQCPNSCWQWAAGMQATFGLRNHEVFRVADISMIREGIIQVGENTKTGQRFAYACPVEWIERWKLWDVRLPAVNCDRPNKLVGSAVSKAYKRLGLLTPYAYRDYYGLRLKVRGLDSSLASRSMGNSVAVYERYYLAVLQQPHFIKVFREINSPES